MDFISRNEFAVLQQKFDGNIAHFPIILSVLEGSQDGFILREKYTFIIVHKFGFSFILGEDCDYILFLEKAKNKLKFKVPTLRIYDPDDRLGNTNLAGVERVKLEGQKNTSEVDKSILGLTSVENFNGDFCSNFDLDLFSRFWRNEYEFRTFSLGVTTKDIQGICYATSVANRRAEVDVFVEADSRAVGLATGLVLLFKHNCEQSGVIPVWDCYSNNIPSVKLAGKTGFDKLFKYNFYTLPTGGNK